MTHIEADVERTRASSMVLRYVVMGKIVDLCLPSPRTSARTDELWRHSCFEAFILSLPGAAYYEFNIAPSFEWAAYQFNGYREGMRSAGEMGAPHIEAQRSAERFQLEVALDLRALTGLPWNNVWRLGLSVVIEEKSGFLSYWALAHPPGRPDFHHRDCFTLELPAPGYP